MSEEPKYCFDSENLKGPYRFIYIWEMPGSGHLEQNPDAYYDAMRNAGFTGKGSCAVCGMGITYHYVCEDRDGKRFAVGCECIKRVDEKLVPKAEKARRDHEAAKRAAKKAAETRARHEQERLEYGGFTRQEARNAMNALLEAIRCAGYYESNRALFDAVRETKSDFAIRIMEDCINWCCMTEKQEAILRRVVRDHELAKVAKNEHFGVGQRVVVELENVREFTVGAYPPVQMIVMRDNEGRTFMAYSNSKTYPAPGSTRKFKATIKAHKVYNGTKQTVLTRPAPVN